MKNILIVLLFLSCTTHAGLLDFIDISEARELYENEKYSEASGLFGNVGNDFATLNKANALYKQQLYKEAISEYSSIENAQLDFDKYYNRGNAYAQNGDIELAIQNYEDALKVKDDDDAQFNLELLRKEQQKKDSKQNKKQDTDEKQDEKKQNSEENKKNEKQQSSQQNNSDKKQQDTTPQQQLNELQKRRLEKSLQKNIQTLMIPTGKQQQNDEQNPW